MNATFRNYLNTLDENQRSLACEAVATYLKGATSEKPKTIRSSDNAFELLKHTAVYTEEVVTVIFLNRANGVIEVKEVAKGGITSSVIDNRVILREALMRNATGIILSHNHPSGNRLPSGEDVKQTEKLGKACKTMEIALLDHIIVAGDGFFSFADENYL